MKIEFTRQDVSAQRPITSESAELIPAETLCGLP